jgi:hypothetical protein
MTVSRAIVLAALLIAPAARAQDAYKVEPLKAGPPDGVAAPIKATLATEGVRVLDPEGKSFAEVWIRKAIPAAGKPEGAKGTVQFPVLGEGELLGAVRFVSEGHDYRDQAVPPGVYTLRYGLQPVNGDHLGVSPFRDYALLVPAARDASTEPLTRKKLETQSAEAAGSSHPTVLMLVAAPGDAKGAPAIARDEAKNTWGAVIGLPLEVKGASGTTPLLVQLVVVGTAM